ncbi:MAG: methyltransferase domain-containing protein [Deltaproteobacteria bacterium]|nr:methyltransferase domain-containing protein [Deltaproteobacteria bacterium]
MMKTALLDMLICPACLPDEMALSCRIDNQKDDDIITGSLHCNRCNESYSITDAIASFIPASALDHEAQNRYEDPALLASYLWSHYADLSGDTDATPAYSEWAERMAPSPGVALDAGCAVGRFTFEMAAKSDFAVGIDRSRTFISAARDLMKQGRLAFHIPMEGALQEFFTLQLPDTWRVDAVDFIVGDIQSLPFPSTRFSSVASLNLIDKLPRPLKHLEEMNRVANIHGAQFLFSDPFSWCETVTQKENWLGGTETGPFEGRGIDNVAALFTGDGGHMLPPWHVERKGSIWWKIRTHKNLFELIRSRSLKASR